MLHRTAVPLSLLEVLLGLQEKTATAGFALAGGTSLALRMGHRLSVDLDFFTTTHFDVPDLALKMPTPSLTLPPFKTKHGLRSRKPSPPPSAPLNKI